MGISKKAGIIIGGGAAVVAAVAIGLGVWLNRPAPSEAELSAPQAKPAQSQSAPASLPQRDPDADPEALAQKLGESIGASFGEDKVTVEYDKADDAILISVWDSDMLAGAQVAISGDEEIQSAWEEMRQSLVVLCNTAREYASLSGMPDIDVVVNLLNENDMDKILLTVKNGDIVYDYTRPTQIKPG